MCGVVVGAAAIVGVTSVTGLSAGALAADGPPPVSSPDTDRPGVASLNPALAPFENQPVRWHECQLGPNDAIGAYLDGSGAQCAGISVPLDYARPEGREITLGVSRIRATDAAHRRGTLMVNPGGPGGSALDFTPTLRALLGEVAGRFDLVGMDPRFVGRSAPLDCGPLLDRDWARGGGPDEESFERTAEAEAEIAAACAVHSDVLPFASTRNTARDMDIVRAVLGERRTSYVGFSYGTYLGAVYMQMFPDRVDRFVLDSAVDPAAYSPRVLRDAGDLLEGALREWAGWAAGRAAQFGLGSTPGEVLATVDGIYAAAARGPLSVDGVEFDAADLPGLLIASLVDDSAEASDVLAMGVRAFADAARGRVPAPNPHLDDFLDGVATAGPAVPAAGPVTGVGRGRGGAAGVAPSGSVSAFQSAQLAVLCGDVPASRVGGDYLADIRRHHRAQPHVGAAIWNLTPCAFWPVRPLEAPTRVANDVPALVVAAEKDTRTPYAGSRALRRVLSASRLVTLRGARVHGVYGGRSGCVDDAVNGYLRAGVLPAADLTCTRPPAPAGSPPE